MRTLWMALAAGAVLAAAPAWSGSWDYSSRAGAHRAVEFKEKFRDGPCKVERELKRDGSYKEERECKGVVRSFHRHVRSDYEEKYSDGPCKIEREWKRDGTFKEKIDCKGPSQRVRYR